MSYRLGLLGGFLLTRDDLGQDLAPLSRRVVAYLALYGQTSRVALAGTLWPDVGDSSALHSLRSVLWRLDQSSPGLVVVARADVRLAAAVRVDVHEQDLALEGPGSDPPGRPARWPAADLLPGWYDDWVLERRECLRQRRLSALEQAAVRLGRRGHYGQAVEAALQAVAGDPLRETAHRILIELHRGEGNLADAHRQYHAYASRLHAELAVEPSRQLVDLMRSLGPLIPAPRPPPPPGAGRGPALTLPRLAAATFEALPGQAAVLDTEGTIVLVNDAWRDFGRQGGADAGCGPGSSYLRVCERAERAGLDVAGTAAAALAAVLTGSAPQRDVDYACQTPHQRRRFQLRVRRLPGLPEVLVLHQELSAQVGAAEQRLARAGHGAQDREPLRGRPGPSPQVPDRRRSPFVAVLVVHLDAGATSHEAEGHLDGDALSTQVARRLTSQVRRADAVTRWGRDGLFLVLADCRADSARQMLQRVQAAASGPTRISDLDLDVTASVGIAVGLAGRDEAELLRCASESAHGRPPRAE